MRDAIFMVCTQCEGPIQTDRAFVGKLGECPYCNSIVVARDDGKTFQNVFIDHRVLEDTRLGNGVWAFYVEILRFAWSGEPFTVHQEKMRTLMRRGRPISPRTIRKYFLDLERCGHVRLEPAGNVRTPFTFAVTKPFPKLKSLQPQRSA